MTSRVTWIGADDPPDCFPSVEQALAEPDGLLAAGGDLSTARLLWAYRHGIFPWYDAGQPPLWWSPDPRCVFCQTIFTRPAACCDRFAIPAQSLGSTRPLTL